MSRSITSKFLLVLALLLPSVSWGAVATDAFSYGSCVVGLSTCTTGNTQLTVAHTTNASASNLAVAVFISCGAGGAATAPSVSTVTYAGTGLTQLQSVTPAATRRAYLYGWPSGSSPTTGTNNIVVTLASSLLTGCDTDAKMFAIGMSVLGSDTSSQYVTSNTNSGTGTTASLVVSSNPTGSMGFSTGCAGGGVTSSTEGAIDVTDIDTNTGCGTAFGMDVAPTDASWSFTIPSDTWVTAGLVFNASGGGGGGGSAARTLMLMGVGQ